MRTLPAWIINLGVTVLLLAAVPAGAQDQKPDHSRAPGVVIDHNPAASRQYIGSPSLAVLPKGDYVASHDFFGPATKEHERAVTAVFGSRDRGQTWRKLATVDGQFWSTLFVHRGALNLLGTDTHHGNAIVRRSADDGIAVVLVGAQEVKRAAMDK